MGPPVVPPDEARFLRRLLLTIAVGGSAVLIALLLWYASTVVLMLFAGVLLAAFLRTLAEGVAAVTRLREGIALTLTVVVLLGVAVGVGTLMAPSISSQIDQLAQQLPRAVQRFAETLQQYAWGRWLFDQGGNAAAGATGTLQQAATALTRVIEVGANLIIIGFLGIYFAAQPRLYLDGLLVLVPRPRRDRMREVLDEAGFELRWWLLGQCFAMLLIGTLTTLGLWLLGIPLALILGVIAGLLNFVPNFGPWIAAIPGVLIAVAESPVKGAWVIAVYAGVQMVESYIITPMVQQRTVDLPPAATITSQVLMGILFGVLGLAMATPLLVVVLVVAKMLYVEDVLGEHMRLPGRDRRGRSGREMY